MGKVGTPVRLTVRSGGQERDVTVTRRAAPPWRIILEPTSKTEYHSAFEYQEQGRWRKFNEVTYTAAP